MASLGAPVTTRAKEACALSPVWLFLNFTECSPPGSSLHEILQARKLQWVSISSPRASSPPRDRTRIYLPCLCIGRWVLSHCAVWEAHEWRLHFLKNILPFQNQRINADISEWSLGIPPEINPLRVQLGISPRLRQFVWHQTSVEHFLSLPYYLFHGNWGRYKSYFSRQQERLKFFSL